MSTTLVPRYRALRPLRLKTRLGPQPFSKERLVLSGYESVASMPVSDIPVTSSGCKVRSELQSFILEFVSMHFAVPNLNSRRTCKHI